MSTSIFLSHSTKYKDIAVKLKSALQALQKPEEPLDIRLSEDMPGSVEWRNWIEAQATSADIFLLIYPHAGMDMAWSSYELGRFYGTKGSILCIRNTDIDKPPPVFEPYQAYNADAAGLTKFIDELFVTGQFTKRRALNAEIGNPLSQAHAQAANVATELAKEFAQARIREHFYERRLVMTIRYGDAGQIDFEKSTVHGNSEGLSLLRQGATMPIKWSEVRTILGPNAEWLMDLERALPSIPTGALPPTLPPFRGSTGTYIPVVVKAESVDRVLTQVIVIFVDASVERLLPLLGWSFPEAMPEPFKHLLRLVRMMFRARWEILEPRYQEVKFRPTSPERRAEIGRLILADFDRMRADNEAEGGSGMSNFFQTFDRSLRKEVEACGTEWAQLTDKLRGSPALETGDLTGLISDFLRNNSKWLAVAGKQFCLKVPDLDEP